MICWSMIKFDTKHFGSLNSGHKLRDAIRSEAARCSEAKDPVANESFHTDVSKCWRDGKGLWPKHSPIHYQQEMDEAFWHMEGAHQVQMHLSECLRGYGDGTEGSLIVEMNLAALARDARMCSLSWCIPRQMTWWPSNFWEVRTPVWDRWLEHMPGGTTGYCLPWDMSQSRGGTLGLRQTSTSYILLMVVW